MADIPFRDPKAFEVWLLDRWKEKDKMLEAYFETGRFPSIPASEKDRTQHDDGLIETEMKLRRWFDIAEIFVVLTILALVVDGVVTLWAKYVLHIDPL